MMLRNYFEFQGWNFLQLTRNKPRQKCKGIHLWAQKGFLVKKFLLDFIYSILRWIEVCPEKSNKTWNVLNSLTRWKVCDVETCSKLLRTLNVLQYYLCSSFSLLELHFWNKILLTQLFETEKSFQLEFQMIDFNKSSQVFEKRNASTRIYSALLIAQSVVFGSIDKLTDYKRADGVNEVESISFVHFIENRVKIKELTN